MSGKKVKGHLVYGFGINDSETPVSKYENGKQTKCPFYQRWVDMLSRCYGASTKKLFPTYADCSVVEEWKYFSVFRTWMETQDWQGNQLDKDIVSPGNKIYSPEMCVFVSPFINSLLNDSAASRGAMPIGVYRTPSKKYAARLRLYNGEHKHLGTFNAKTDAYAAYTKAKAEHIVNVANTQKDLKIKRGLINHVKRYTSCAV